MATFKKLLQVIAIGYTAVFGSLVALIILMTLLVSHM